MKISLSNIVSAFDEFTVGSKVVVTKDVFLSRLEPVLEQFNFESCRVPGQGYVKLPDKFRDYVTAGAREHSLSPEDYVLRQYRGRVRPFLKRAEFVKPDNVTAIVYTINAYLNDPDSTPKENDRVIEEGATHVLVAILASKGPKSTVSPSRFVANLAGGNNEYLTLTAGEIRDMAQKVNEYVGSWGTIAD